MEPSPEVVALLLRWLADPPPPEYCLQCGALVDSLPGEDPTHCPRCGADLVPF
jgi:hypothetical protein